MSRPCPDAGPGSSAEAVTLDHLSHGRVILGVGAGDTNDPGFSKVGEPVATKTRAEMLDEGLEILTGLWTGEPVQFKGRHYHVEGLRLAAAPVQQPRIPI